MHANHDLRLLMQIKCFSTFSLQKGDRPIGSETEEFISERECFPRNPCLKIVEKKKI